MRIAAAGICSFMALVGCASLLPTPQGEQTSLTSPQPSATLTMTATVPPSAAPTLPPTPSEAPTTTPSPEPTEGKTEFSPCDALSRSQIEQIIGPLTTDPQPSASVGENVGYFQECTYSSEKYFVYLSYGPEPGTVPRDYYKEVRRAASSSAEDISGLDQAAFWDPDAMTLYVLRGDLVLSLLVSGPNDSRAAAIKIAQIALVRIP